MKRILLLSGIILFQVATTFAQIPTTRVNAEKVRMYRQPSLNMEVMRILTSDNEIKVVRKLSHEWSLVEIDNEAGYVLNTFLKAKKTKRGMAAKTAAAPATARIK